MSKTIRGIALITVGCGAVALASALPPPLPPSSARPAREVESTSKAKIRWETQEVDFGSIMDTEEPETEFGFTNVGESPLIIKDVKSTCGCTVPQLEKLVYQPGESGTIKVQFHARSKKGAQNRPINISTNDRDEPMQTIAIKAYVRQLVSADPFTLNFGRLNKGETRTERVVVTGRTSDFEATRATLKLVDTFGVKLIGTEPYQLDDEPGQRTIFEITLGPSTPVGRYTDELSVRTNDPRMPILTVPVSAEIVGDLTAIPPRLSFGRVEPSQTFMRELRLASRTQTPFKVLGVETKSGLEGIEYEITPVFTSEHEKEAHVYSIKVSGTVPRGILRLAGSLIVRTDVKDEGTIEIPFYGAINRRTSQTPRVTPSTAGRTP